MEQSVEKQFRLDGQVAVVTGACGLLGRQHAAALAEAGAHVVIVDMSADSCHALGQELEARGLPKTLPAVADITMPADLEALRAEILRRFDRLDVLVNNAAINDMVEKQAGKPVTFEELPVSAWRRSIDVNVTGTFLCCQILGAEMARRGRGSVINIASTYGVVAPDQSLYRDRDGTQTMYKSAAYPASKGAVLALTRYLAAYWGHRGVRVNSLSPGGVENGQTEAFIQRYSERTPLGRMAKANEYKGAIVFLASEASSYLTGANLVVDGGFTVW